MHRWPGADAITATILPCLWGQRTAFAVYDSKTRWATCLLGTQASHALPHCVVSKCPGGYASDESGWWGGHLRVVCCHLNLLPLTANLSNLWRASCQARESVQFVKLHGDLSSSHFVYPEFSLAWPAWVWFFSHNENHERKPVRFG